MAGVKRKPKNIKTKKAVVLKISQNHRFFYFKELKKNQKYWFYLIKDYEKDKVFPYILDELEKKDILYLKKDRESMLIHVQN